MVITDCLSLAQVIRLRYKLFWGKAAAACNPLNTTHCFNHVTSQKYLGPRVTGAKVLLNPYHLTRLPIGHQPCWQQPQYSEVECSRV